MDWTNIFSSFTELPEAQRDCDISAPEVRLPSFRGWVNALQSHLQHTIRRLRLRTQLRVSANSDTAINAIPSSKASFTPWSLCFFFYRCEVLFWVDFPLPFVSTYPALPTRTATNENFTINTNAAVEMDL